MYKDILVHVDSTQAVGERLVLAKDLAQRFGAHVTGLYVLSQFTIPVYAEIPIGDEILEQARGAIREKANRARERFEREMGDDVPSEWRQVEDIPASAISDNALYFDLVVLGQSDPDDVEDTSLGLVDRVVLESGRPNLVVPYIGTPGTVGNRVLIAWNGSRESVRAVSDSLPILKTAEQVIVLMVNPQDAEVDEGELPSADICLHLARHGVNAEARSVTARDIDVGDELLSRVADDNIDLVVMGAYGHSRFRELVLGGATRFLLQHMTVPVLMSH